MEAGKTRRIRRDPDTTRRLILDAAERIMVEEGYAAMTTRRVAQALGINAATIHYYYPATDDLFIALHRRMTGRQLEQLEAALASSDPLDAIWNFQASWNQSALGVEFLALSNHRKSIQSELATLTEEVRDLQARAIERSIGGSLPDADILPPVALATILVAIARTLTNEERIGISRGHAEVRRFVGWALARLARTSDTA